MCDVSSRNGDTLRIRLSPSLAWHSGPETRQHRQRQKLSTTVWRTFPNFIPYCWAWGPQTLSESSPSTNSSVLPDRLLTRLSALYCQSSCQATILLENTGLLQLAQAVITLQIQALKKQSNSWNGPIIFLHEPIFQMQ